MIGDDTNSRSFSALPVSLAGSSIGAALEEELDDLTRSRQISFGWFDEKL
jgi:hypothetical protein